MTLDAKEIILEAEYKYGRKVAESGGGFWRGDSRPLPRSTAAALEALTEAINVGK